MADLSPMVLQTDALNLPKAFTAMLRSKKVEIIASDKSIIITPFRSSLLDAPKLESDGHEVQRFLERKRLEKELEHGG